MGKVDLSLKDYMYIKCRIYQSQGQGLGAGGRETFQEEGRWDYAWGTADVVRSGELGARQEGVKG